MIETDPRTARAADAPTRPLHVCLISTASSAALGGATTYVGLLGENLSRHGHDVSGVARFARSSPAATAYGDADPTTPSGVVASHGFETRLVAPGARLRPLLNRLATLNSRAPLQKIGVRLFERAYRAPFARAVPHSANVLHFIGTGWEMLGFAALAEARRRRGAVFAVTPFVHPQTWGDGPLDIRLYNRADAVFVCSEYEAAHLKACGVSPERLRHTVLAPDSGGGVGNGAAFRARHHLGERPIILFIGRKEPYKGYHALCQAMTEVHRQVPDACLVAIGPDTAPPFPAVPEGALLDLGRAEPAEKEDALAACDIFCMPSSAESFGLVYVEAWSYGKPVVGGPAPAVRELIRQGIDGYAVPQEPTAIADALIRLARDPSLRRRLGKAGRTRQRETFTWDAVTRLHEQVYRECARSGAAEA